MGFLKSWKEKLFFSTGHSADKIEKKKIPEQIEDAPEDEENDKLSEFFFETE